MIHFDEDKYMLVFTLMKDEVSSPQSKAINTLRLSEIMSLYNVNNNVLHTSTLYWDLLHACLDNIETGKWSTLPRFWLELLCDTRDTPMSESQIAAENRKYHDHLTILCRKLGISSIAPNELCDKELMYKWILQKDGARDMLGVANVLMRAHLFFTRGFFDGITNNAAHEKTPFSDINQAIAPLNGGTQEQVLRQNNFNKPFKRHEAFI